jgi:hypothetical protein
MKLIFHLSKLRRNWNPELTGTNLIFHLSKLWRSRFDSSHLSQHDFDTVALLWKHASNVDLSIWRKKELKMNFQKIWIKYLPTMKIMILSDYNWGEEGTQRRFLKWQVYYLIGEFTDLCFWKGWFKISFWIWILNHFKKSSAIPGLQHRKCETNVFHCNIIFGFIWISLLRLFSLILFNHELI